MLACYVVGLLTYFLQCSLTFLTAPRHFIYHGDKAYLKQNFYNFLFFAHGPHVGRAPTGSMHGSGATDFNSHIPRRNVTKITQKLELWKRLLPNVRQHRHNDVISSAHTKRVTQVNSIVYQPTKRLKYMQGNRTLNRRAHSKTHLKSLIFQNESQHVDHKTFNILRSHLYNLHHITRLYDVIFHAAITIHEPKRLVGKK